MSAVKYKQIDPLPLTETGPYQKYLNLNSVRSCFGGGRGRSLKEKSQHSRKWNKEHSCMCACMRVLGRVCFILFGIYIPNSFKKQCFEMNARRSAQTSFLDIIALLLFPLPWLFTVYIDLITHLPICFFLLCISPWDHCTAPCLEEGC